MPSEMVRSITEREIRPTSAGRCARARIRFRSPLQSIRDCRAFSLESLALYLYSSRRRGSLLYQSLGKSSRARLDLENLDSGHRVIRSVAAGWLCNVAASACALTLTK